MSSPPRIAIAIVAPAPPVTTPEPVRLWRRSPAVPVAVAMAFGILLDSSFGIALPVWLFVSAAALCGWLICWRRGALTASALCLLASVLLAGAGWHHLRWSMAQVNDIHAFASDRPEPVRIQGRLVDQPTIIPRRQQELPVAIPQYDRTLCTLKCMALVADERVIPVSGQVRLDVTGHLEGAAVGDVVDVVGQFARVRGPHNPGEFNYRDALRGSGINVQVYCGEPEDVRVTEPVGKSWRGWQARLREQAEQLLAEQLSDRTKAVGTALLLGTRTGITDELRQAFAESGTMHILAISGANVGVLAGLLWLIARIARCGRFTTAAIVLLGILGYAFLADSQPPVLRAVLMFTAVLAGRPWFRTTPLVNGLAIAALGVLVGNPAHLFDVGAQLSFLAVAALIWTPSWIPARWRKGLVWNPSDLSTPAWSAWWWPTASRSLLMGVGSLAAIWLFTLPLTIARFHLFSPIGLFVNLLLAPVVVFIMWSGYALLMLGLLAKWAGVPFGFLFDGGLRLMLWIVEESAAVEWGHAYLPGPGEGWLAGYYVCLLAVACGLTGGRLRQWGWRIMLVWVVAGAGAALLPRHTGELRCTFLSVGHGLAVLIEMPNGKTLLYDAGQLQNGSRARDVVQGALWEGGIPRIDALMISHADIDHFNGVPGLARTMPIGEVFVHPSFLDFDQESVRLTCDRLAERNVPIRNIWSGDRLMLDGRVSVVVRAPDVNERHALDNANSVVLEIAYAGRKILLTGDLEQEGLRKLLQHPSSAIDVLLAPHHGSLDASTPELASWSAARLVVVSGGRKDPQERLHSVYGPQATVLSTATSGAVRVAIAADGALQCTPFVRGTE
jgi:competence protein ComEC